MSRWRIERHYGFGAAQIPIQPEPHRAERVGISEGMASLFEELTEGGVWAAANRAAGEASAIFLVVLILAAVAITIARDHSDVSPVEVVFFEPTANEAPPLIEDLTPVPVPVSVPAVIPLVKEIPKPKPVQQVEPEPQAPQQIVERPKPKPVEVPRPVPQREIARPRIVMDAVRPERSVQAPQRERLARSTAPRASRDRVTPQMQAPAALAPPAPERSPSKRAFRVASARPGSSNRPRGLPAIAPSPDSVDTFVSSSSTRSSRASGPRPRNSGRARTRAPELSPAPSLAADLEPAATPQRTFRAAPTMPTTPARRTPRPTASVARVATPTRSSLAVPVSRAGRATRQAPLGSGGEHVRLSGVPLAELAACLTDREEDRLKQAVVAAVTTQEECVSSKGTYRFVETKNLNAFLMWIDRAPGRSGSDRCTELGHALECLRGASQQAAR